MTHIHTHSIYPAILLPDQSLIPVGSMKVEPIHWLKSQSVLAVIALLCWRFLLCLCMSLDESLGKKDQSELSYRYRET